MDFCASYASINPNNELLAHQVVLPALLLGQKSPREGSGYAALQDLMRKPSSLAPFSTPIKI